MSYIHFISTHFIYATGFNNGSFPVALWRCDFIINQLTILKLYTAAENNGFVIQPGMPRSGS